MVSKYTNVGIPDDLLGEIDKVIQNTKLGYKSRAEFFKETAREKLIKMKELGIDYELKLK